MKGFGTDRTPDSASESRASLQSDACALVAGRPPCHRGCATVQSSGRLGPCAYFAASWCRVAVSTTPFDGLSLEKIFKREDVGSSVTAQPSAGEAYVQ